MEIWLNVTIMPRVSFAASSLLYRGVTAEDTPTAAGFGCGVSHSGRRTAPRGGRGEGQRRRWWACPPLECVSRARAYFRVCAVVAGRRGARVPAVACARGAPQPETKRAAKSCGSVTQKICARPPTTNTAAAVCGARHVAV